MRLEWVVLGDFLGGLDGRGAEFRAVECLYGREDAAECAGAAVEIPSDFGGGGEPVFGGVVDLGGHLRIELREAGCRKA